MLIAWGAVPGLAAALALTRGMRSLIYGISPIDPASFGAAAIVLSGVALAASYLPARRAALADPTQALRGD